MIAGKYNSYLRAFSKNNSGLEAKIEAIWIHCSLHLRDVTFRSMTVYFWYLHVTRYISEIYAPVITHITGALLFCLIKMTWQSSINESTNTLIRFLMSRQYLPKTIYRIFSNKRSRSNRRLPQIYAWSLMCRRCICRRSRRYCLGYFSDEWEHAPPTTRAIAELYRRHAYEVELESPSQALRR